ncbi:hypothetical protein COLO4_14104 [Corchorus olitorius]|uniref:Uncharacterized protein n=1 Tax=Corchorus olitorius TaxID=93759 RepID=A0A1R3JTH2_9ROSI|nr:hypothetical protein COLO4_14104 [Corchorus olitorius]
MNFFTFSCDVYAGNFSSICTAKRTSGIVVNIGFQVTSIVPISHGKVMQKVGVEVIGLGALKLTGFLRELMQQNNVNFESLYTVRTLKETGKSKHYGFIEFKNPEVAEVVADCMHNYLLFEHLLQVHLIPLEHVHPKFKAVIGIEPVYIFSLSTGSNLEKHDVKVSVNAIAIVIKAVSIALEKNQKLMLDLFLGAELWSHLSIRVKALKTVSCLLFEAYMMKVENASYSRRGCRMLETEAATSNMDRRVGK